MAPADIITGLGAIGPRAPGSDAERRAARWLAAQLKQGGRTARLEPFWCRPNRALAHAWHVGLALAGSLLMVSVPRVGGALVLLALVSLLADELTGFSLGRRLTPEHASQNVVSEGPGEGPTVRLVLTANYDSGRTGLVWRGAPRRLARRAGRLGGHRAPGWLGWLAIAFIWLLVIAILRLGGATSSSLGALQLVPSVALVPALAALLELAGADPSPAANDNASGVAAAVAVARALDSAPPRHLSVDVVLEGAGEGGGIGLRRFLRAQRGRRSATNTVVVGLAPCGAGAPVWWLSDGSLLPLRCHARLRAAAAGLAASEPGLGLTAVRGRGATPALPARSAGLPAIAIGRVDERGLAPGSHTDADKPEWLEPRAVDGTVQLALMLIDAIDADLGRVAATAAPLAPTAA
ncbi:MAG: M28 family peptidase [Solirubrobacteraceae bacterium]